MSQNSPLHICDLHTVCSLCWTVFSDKGCRIRVWWKLQSSVCLGVLVFLTELPFPVCKIGSIVPPTIWLKFLRGKCLELLGIPKYPAHISWNY